MRRFVGTIALVVCWKIATLQAGLPTPWRFLNPLPQGNDLFAAWATATNDVFVGGHGGTILRWDGNHWTTQSTPTQKTVFGIHGTSPKDVWAVGGDGYTLNQTNRSLVLHFDGQAWKEIKPPDFSGYTYVLNSVFAIATNDVWATQDGGPSLVHWDGKSWQFELLSFPVPVEGSFRCVFAVGSDHLFAAGTHGQIIHRHQGKWSLEQKTENGGFSSDLLQSIWASDPEHVYVGGNWGQLYRRNADGTWSDTGLERTISQDNTIRYLWGRSPTELYLMGNASVRLYSGSLPPVRYDFEYKKRSQWLMGTGLGDVLLAAGPGGVVNEVLLDDHPKAILSALTAGDTREAPSMVVSDAVGCGQNGVLVFGSSLYSQAPSPLCYFDGATFYPFKSLPAEMRSQSRVNALICSGLNDITMGWDNWMEPGHGVHHWDGTSWSLVGMPYGMPGTLVGLWRSPTGRLYGCSPYNVRSIEATNDWVDVLPFGQLPNEVSITAFAGRTDSELYIALTGGRIQRYDGSRWIEETTPGAGPVTRLVVSEGDIYALGQNGLAWYRTASGWQQFAAIEARQGDTLQGAVVTTNGVYAAEATAGGFTGGGLGRLWLLKGSQATMKIEGLSSPMVALAQTGQGHLFGFTSSSTVLTDAPLPGGHTQQLVDLATTQFVALGNSGVSLRADPPGTGRVMVAAWPTTTSDKPFGLTNDLAISSEQWVLRSDTYYAGTVLPLVQLEFNYDPAFLPSDFTPETAVLLRFGGTNWSTLAAITDPSSHTIATTSPTSLSTWRFGSAEAPATPPALTAVLLAGPQLRLQWPASATGYELEASPQLGEKAQWTRDSSSPTTEDGWYRVTIGMSDQQHFYRLRKP
jgi:hypothetical protein